MSSSALQSAIVSFTVIALVVSIFYVEEIQRSKRKHMLAGAFIFLAAFMLILELKV